MQKKIIRNLVLTFVIISGVCNYTLATDTASVPLKIFGYQRCASCALSSDASLLASAGGSDGSILIWDAKSAKVIRTLIGHTGSVRFVSFASASDRALLLSGSYDQTAKVWDAATGECLGTFDKKSDVLVGAMAPDGSKIVVGTFDGFGSCIDLATGTTLKALKADNFFTAAGFSADGSAITWAGERGPAAYYNLSTQLGDTIELPPYPQNYTYVALSPNADRILAGTDDTARLYSIDDKTLIRQFAGHSQEVNSVAFSSDGSKVLTGSRDCTIRLWDAASGESLRTFTGHTHIIWSAQLVHHDSLLLSTSADQTIRLWDVASGQIVQTFNGHTLWVNDAAFSPDGSKIVAGSAGNDIHVWDVASTECLMDYMGHTGTVTTTVFSKNGDYILSGSYDSTARLWETGTGTTVRVLPGDAWVTCVALSPVNNDMLVGSENNVVRLYPFSADTVERIFWQSSMITALSFSHDGTTILTGGDQTMRLWNRSDGKIIRTFSCQSAGIADGGFAFNETMIYAGLTNASVCFWDTQSGDTIRTFKADDNAVYEAAVSSDGKFVAGAGYKRAYLWEFSSGKMLRRFTGFSDHVSSVAFSPDGKTLITGSDDENVKMWDISDVTVAPVSFSPQGRIERIDRQARISGNVVIFPAGVVTSIPSSATMTISTINGVLVVRTSTLLSSRVEPMKFPLNRKLPAGIYIYHVQTDRDALDGCNGLLSVIR